MAGRKLQWCQLQSRPRPNSGLRAMEWGSDRQVACRQTWAAGSLVAGILALVSERSTMSLRWSCRVRRPEVYLHDSACDSLTSTTDPQIHTWGSQMLMPRRRPTAILTTSSTISTRRRRWGWHAASRRCVCLMPRVVEPCRMCRYGVPWAGKVPAGRSACPKFAV